MGNMNAKLNTPYFLEQGGMIRDSKNRIVCELFDYNDLTIRRIIDALNRYDWLEQELAAANEKISELQSQLDLERQFVCVKCGLRQELRIRAEADF